MHTLKWISFEMSKWQKEEVAAMRMSSDVYCAMLA